MTQLDILAVGNLVRDEDKNVIEAHSTSVLIRADGHNIVVDPSTKYMKPAVKTSFKQIGVFPKDVDMVVFTHMHEDHIQEAGFYPKARIYVHSGSDIEVPGAKVITGNEFELCKDVRLVHTPGHCPEHMSVFVNADRHYVVAGDAVPTEENFIRNVPPRINTDEKAALESIKKIRDYADVVIPGHGFPFMADQ